MSYLLTEPTAVLAVGGSETTVGRLRSVLTTGSGPATALLPVDTLDAARQAIADRDDIGCALVLGPADEATADGATADGATGVAPVEVVRAIKTTHERLPVVVHAPETTCDLVALAAERDCVVLPDDVADDRLREAVADALATFDDRRDRHAESSLFTTLLQEGELSIFAKDREGRHVYKSDIEDDTDPESVIGRTDLEVTAHEVMEKAEQTYEDDMEVLETGKPIYRKVIGYDYSDHEHWSQATKVPWYGDNGELRGLIGFSEDITQRKIYKRRIQEQAERIDQFISYISHDLRTPLQIAYGSLQQARHGDEAALDKVEEAIERIEAIVDDLSSLSKDDAAANLASGTLQQLRAESITSDFVPLVEELWSIIGPEEAELVVEFPQETEVGTEAETIRPAVENLLKNAVDHAGPEVRVEVGETEERGFYVADDGPGIPPDERPKVLEAGYTTSEEGTGTGLDIVAETADQEGWDLTVTESESGGARFEITGVPVVTTPWLNARSADRIDLAENCDVGGVSLEGTATHDPEAEQWTVTANGQNMWNDTHEFHLVHGSGQAPVRVEGRVVDLDGVDEYSKAGFTIRAGLDERDPFGYVGVTESHGSEVTWREAADGFTDSDQFQELPGTFPWYRIEYVDGEVTCALSPDGEEWRYVDQRRLDLGDEVTVGLVVCSHSTNRVSEATFADVRAYELDAE